MKAVVLNEYGGPEVLRYAEMPEPQIGADEVLDTPGEFPSKLGLQDLVSPLRLRGMASMAGVPIVAITAEGDRMTSLAVGGDHACALSAGVVWCWGRGDSGQLGFTGTASGLAQPLADTGLFPSAANQMFRVGEDTGTLDQQLETAAIYFDRELDFKIKRFTNLFEPAVILFMGLVVGFVAIALVSAMYGIFRQVNV